MTTKADLKTIHETLLYVRDELNGDTDLGDVRHAIDEAVDAVEQVQDPHHHRRNVLALAMGTKLTLGLLFVLIWLYGLKSTLGLDLSPGPSMLHGLYELTNP